MCACEMCPQDTILNSSQTQYSYLVLPGNESVLVTEALNRRSWWKPAKTHSVDNKGEKQKIAAEDDDWDLWCGTNGQPFNFKRLEVGKRRIANCIQGHSEVCSKSGLAATLARLEAKAGGSGALPWVPVTSVLTGGIQTPPDSAAQYTKLFTSQQEQGKGTVWIVKPVNLNRGNGIEVFNKDDVLQYVSSKRQGSKWIVQKYIEKPALVQGRKFDIRAYVLVTPDKSVYMHDEAYVRTSSTPYNLQDLSNKSSHLTNDAVQKHLSTYHTYEDHCKMSMEQLQHELGPGIDVQCKVLPAMREAARQVFSEALPRMNTRGYGLCWELLGLDFMIDAAGQVYLIEINASPALFRAGAYLSDLLPRVVEECVQKAIDPSFPPPSEQAQQDHNSPTPLNGFRKLNVMNRPLYMRNRNSGMAARQAGTADLATRMSHSHATTKDANKSHQAQTTFDKISPTGGLTQAAGGRTLLKSCSSHSDIAPEKQQDVKQALLSPEPYSKSTNDSSSHAVNTSLPSRTSVLLSPRAHSTFHHDTHASTNEQHLSWMPSSDQSRSMHIEKQPSLNSSLAKHDRFLKAPLGRNNFQASRTPNSYQNASRSVAGALPSVFRDQSMTASRQLSRSISIGQDDYRGHRSLQPYQSKDGRTIVRRTLNPARISMDHSVLNQDLWGSERSSAPATVFIKTRLSNSLH